MQPNHIEKLEVLDGSRSGSRERAAVRLEDVRELLQLAQVKTKEVTAAPTPDDFNSLLKDIKEISNRLNAVAQALQGKLLR
ncbi:hypothetical protein ASD74_06200 [Rhizobium sp. Root564]|nr:hypothetical protein ASD74_06200 [Rhizobium sp. Root564]